MQMRRRKNHHKVPCDCLYERSFLSATRHRYLLGETWLSGGPHSGQMCFRRDRTRRPPAFICPSKVSAEFGCKLFGTPRIGRTHVNVYASRKCQLAVRTVSRSPLESRALYSSGHGESSESYRLCLFVRTVGIHAYWLPYESG